MGLGRKLILLVEDDQSQGEEIVQMIKDLNKYDVIWAKDGFEGLYQIRKHGRFMGFAGNKINCVLLDMRMPKMDGVEFIKRLRKREKWRFFERYVPVIFLTAFQEKEYFRAAMNEYACEYLNKPVSSEELEVTLKKILEDYDYFSAVESNRKTMINNLKS